MHARRALAAGLLAWRLEAACRRRLAVLAERLAAAAAARRLRASFLAWARAALAPALALPRGPNKVSTAGSTH